MLAFFFFFGSFTFNIRGVYISQIMLPFTFSFTQELFIYSLFFILLQNLLFCKKSRIEVHWKKFAYLLCSISDFSGATRFEAVNYQHLQSCSIATFIFFFIFLLARYIYISFLFIVIMYVN